MLNFFRATERKKIVMPDKIRVSFQIADNVSPFSMTDFTIIKYHFAGTILDTTCKTFGIFSIGNINPLSISVGRNMPTRLTNIAVRWEFVIVEINNPKDNDVMMNNTDSEKSKNRLPLIGSSSTK